MANPEIQRDTLSWTPAKAPDNLLKNFRATLEQRWNEFDRATLQEAIQQNPFGKIWAQSLRDADANFINAKNAFDQAKAMLATIHNDAELKANTQVLVTVESTLKALTDHLKEIKPEEKNKAINIILAKTTADLSRFKADITGNEEDKKQAEVAIAAEKAIPRAVLAATTTAGGLSLISSAEAKDLASEWTKDLKKWIKWWIAEQLGFDKKTMIEDMAKKAKWESIGFGATIRLMIFSFLNRFDFLGMTDDWTPEELKLAGLKGPAVSQNPVEPQTGWRIENLKEDISYKSWYKGFVRMYYWSLEDTQKWLKVSDLDAPFLYAPFQSMTFSWASVLFEKYKGKDLKWLLEESEFKGITNAWSAFAVLALFVSGDGSKFLKKRYGETIQNMTIRDIIAGIKDTFDIAENIHDIEINGIQDITGFMGKIGDKMNISFNNWKINEEWLKIKAEKLWITDPKLMSFVFIEAAKMPIWKFNTTDSIDKLQSIDDKGKGKLKEILKFGKDIIPVLTANCSLGEKSKYEAEFGKISPTLEDITKMYITLGWKTDFSTMSEPEQLYCYQRTWHFLWNTEFRWEYFDQPMLRAISEKDSPIIPPGIKRVIGSLISVAASATFEKMKWIAWEIYGAMKWYHIAAVWAVLAAYLTYWKRIAWVWQGIAMASLVMIVSDIFSKFGSPGSDGKYTLPSGTKLTEKEWAEALIKGAWATL